MAIYEIYSGPFPVQVFYVNSKKSWKREMKKMESEILWPKTPGICHCFTKDKEPDRIYIIVQQNKKMIPAQIAGLVAHEAFHAWEFICEAMGEVNPSSEFSAYMIQNIVQTILNIKETEE